MITKKKIKKKIKNKKSQKHRIDYFLVNYK